MVEGTKLPETQRTSILNTVGDRERRREGLAQHPSPKNPSPD